MRDNLGRFIKGNIPNAPFKKGNIPWNKDKKGLQIGWNKGTKGICKSWNKGTKGIMKPNSGSFKKGHNAWCKGKKFSKIHRKHLSETVKKQYQNGRIAYNKGKKRPELTGENNPNWKGGKKISQGRLFILMPNHPSANTLGYVANSRLIAEKCLSRYLDVLEIVHHIDRDITNDAPENLFVFENLTAHNEFHLAIRYGGLKLNWLKSNII